MPSLANTVHNHHQIVNYCANCGYHHDCNLKIMKSARDEQLKHYGTLGELLINFWRQFSEEIRTGG